MPRGEWLEAMVEGRREMSRGQLTWHGAFNSSCQSCT